MKFNKFNVFVFVFIVFLVFLGRGMEHDPKLDSNGAEDKKESKLAIEQAKSNASMEKEKAIHSAKDEQVKALEKARIERIKSLEKLKNSWSTSISEDEMTKRKSAYAVSPNIYSTRNMSFPYEGTQAWLGVACDSKSEWAYIGFTESPNLLNTDTESGYNIIKTRVRWGNEIEKVRFSQDWGSKFIHFSNNKYAISKLSSSKNALLELSWHGQSQVYFDFPLTGSTAAIAKIRSICRNFK